MKHFTQFLILFALSLVLTNLSPNVAYAQKAKKSKKDKAEASATDVKPDEDALKAATKLNSGLFTLWRDTVNGSLFMSIAPDQIGKEYIHFSYTENSTLDAFNFRGAFRANQIFTIKKHFDRIEFVGENTNYYFDPNNALAKAAKANINQPILASEKIQKTAKADKDHVVIKLDDIFLSEAFDQIKPSPPTNMPPGFNMFNLGSLSKTKTKYSQIKNYPANTDLVVDYVFENVNPTNYGRLETTDARYVTVTIQHSLIEMPKNNFEGRADDPRLGYFSQRVNDQTSLSYTPWRDLINRWYLEKKDPNASLSEPVEPIVWWIENTTPLEFRKDIMDAVLAWNVAFEQAGFKNAVQCKMQPDDATWDAGDIRYNVLRWTSSPTPPFGGYGPSFVNPRTGQILGADVMLELVFIRGALRGYQNFGKAGAFDWEEAMAQADEMKLQHTVNSNHNHNYCMAAQMLQANNLFGATALAALNTTNEDKDEKEKELIREALHYLVLHEVGHTLGLNHNMKATQIHSPADVHNKPLTAKIGLYGSVMDYPAVNFSSDPAKQGEYYITVPGPYDRWAVEYGYSTNNKNEASQKERLQTVLNRSTDPQLTFGNDADDMRAPGGGIDPRVNIFDLSNDAIGYGIDRIKFANSLLPKLKERFIKNGESYQGLLTNYYVTTGQIGGMASVISRYIGGVYVERDFPGQPKARQPFTPVAAADQKRAMAALEQYLFAPDAFMLPNDLLNYLQPQRRSFDYFGNTEDPKIADRVLSFQRNVLAHLLHPEVMQRINQTEMYGNTYPLTNVLDDLTNAIFKADLSGKVNLYRQNLQLTYVEQLISGWKNPAYDKASQSLILYQLTQIDRMVKANSGNDIATKAHRQNIIFRIKQALENK